MTLCTTWARTTTLKIHQIFRMGIRVPLCWHTMSLVEIRLWSYFQNNMPVFERNRKNWPIASLLGVCLLWCSHATFFSSCIAKICTWIIFLSHFYYCSFTLRHSSIRYLIARRFCRLIFVAHHQLVFFLFARRLFDCIIKKHDFVTPFFCLCH